MKKEDIFDVPGIHQQYEEGFGPLLKRAGAINEEINRNDRTSLTKGLEVGRILLRARPMAAVGEWEPALEAQGISSQRASEFTRGSEAPLEIQRAWRHRVRSGLTA